VRTYTAMLGVCAYATCCQFVSVIRQLQCRRHLLLLLGSVGLLYLAAKELHCVCQDCQIVNILTRLLACDIQLHSGLAI